MTVLLVIAEAPVAGLVKTGLIPPASPAEAADLAAAGLLDTLAAARATPGVQPVVALAGDVRAAERGEQVAEALSGCVVIGQRGRGRADCLANAYADVAVRYPGEAVVQIGMDTPQVTPPLLAAAASGLDSVDAVLGLALDGGWWALALRDPRSAGVLRTIPVSRADTGIRIRRALIEAGHRVGSLPRLSDVDTLADVDLVAEAAPGTRFAEAALLLRARR
ncbi:DUF2064 domain-containing protein [Actinokineospora sp. UTMC 2448]|uniref:TIGR04282 family arsenosugar biosynthesis glycosyltransferase n=1 Tax=Actinokineospora sp. UTMC 2448 TaxID=2268449 RepID=UPI002164B07F|nr:DUF2064 domain-containing protein [Actinokineospora sp. UTMC 2448]UVS76910.1 transferase 1, rSAM/selenodomain-associated [Actinokineospora sp. UTMC 2448]